VTAPLARELIEFAHAMADAARAMLLAAYRGSFAVEVKEDASPVTELDRAVEARLREIVAEHRPGDGFVGEELPDDRADAELVWTADPIDGTKPFVAGAPLFGTLIGLRRGGRYVLGLVDHSVTGDRWIGAEGRGASLNGKAIHTRRCAALALATATSSGPGVVADEAWRRMRPLQRACRWTMFGHDITDPGALAMGLQDIIVDAELGEDDWAAAAALIEAAGGSVTDWEGHPLSPASDGTFLALGDRALLMPCLDLLRPF